ncbi:MAG: class I SAM-dependent methyltransferase [Vicinamibacterales bacterium]
MDPLAGSAWSRATTIESFVRSPPNRALLDYAVARRAQDGAIALDIGCGAGRNVVPLAQSGWTVLGLDLSTPMLSAARQRALDAGTGARARFALAPMHALPVRSDSCDLIVAHGIWNLARSAAEFRAAVREAARVARAGAGLFVFTFSRHTLPSDVEPVAGEPFVYTQFSGEAQCFLTAAQLIEELDAAGFVLDAAVPLVEHNLPQPGRLRGPGAPVIYEAAFLRRVSAAPSA